MEHSWVFGSIENFAPEDINHDRLFSALKAKRYQHYLDGNWAEALSTCDYIIEKYGGTCEDFVIRANIVMKMNDWERAAEDCALAIERNSSSSSAYCTRGLAYRLMGKLDDAEAEFNEALHLNPEDIVVYSNRAAMNLQRSRWQKVIADYTEIINRKEDAYAYTMRGAVYGKLRDLQAAVCDCERAVQLAPTDSTTHANLALVYSMMAKWDEAISECNLAIDHGQLSANILTPRAIAYGKLKRFELALADLNTAITLDPTHLNAWSNRVVIFTKLGMWQEVISDCTEMITMGVGNLQAYKSRGVAYHMIGDNLLAEKDLTHVVEKESSNMISKGRALGARAAVFCAVKKWKLADEDCQRARVLDPLGSERYKHIQHTARVAAENAEKDAEERAESIIEELLQEEAMEKLRLYDHKRRKKIKIKRKKRKDAVYGSDLSMQGKQIHLPDIIDSNEMIETAKFDNDLGIVDYDGEVDRYLSEERAGEKEVGKELKQIRNVSNEQCLSKGNSCNVESFDHLCDDTSSNSIEDSILWTDKLDILCNMVENKNDQEIGTNDTDDKPCSFNSSLPAPHTRQMKIRDVPDRDDENNLSIIDVLLYFLPTFPMFQVEESSSTNAKIDLALTNDCASNKLDRQRKYGFSNHAVLSVAEDESCSTYSASANCDRIKHKKVASPLFNPGDEDARILSDHHSLLTASLNMSRLFDVNTPQRNDLISVGKLAFSLAHIIGRGSFGTVVYAGAHIEFGRAAIKAISKEGWIGRRQTFSFEVSNDREDSSNAATPAEVMAIADRKILLMISQKGAHQNVVRYFGFEEDPNFMYLAIELCEVSLWSVFYEKRMFYKREQFKNISKQRDFTKQLFEGVKFLHSQQIVHGDLRPKNVLFDYDGFLKITDFGLAQKVSFEDDSFSWQHGGPDGSGGWFAPEIYLRGRKTMGVDIFAAGCMVFWVVSNGIHPFDNNPFHVVQGHYQKHVLREKPELLDLVGWMISHCFEDRPSIDEALSHPFLWSNSTRVLYLTEVGNRIDQYKDLLEFVCWTCGSDNHVQNIESEAVALEINTSIEERRWFCVCKSPSKSMPWRKMIHEDLMTSLLRRRKYPSDSTAWFIRFFRNLDQHFHDQTDEGLLCLKTTPSSEYDVFADEQFLDYIRSSSLKQREVIGEYISKMFPNFFLSLWLKVGAIEF